MKDIPMTRDALIEVMGEMAKTEIRGMAQAAIRQIVQGPIRLAPKKQKRPFPGEIIFLNELRYKELVGGKVPRVYDPNGIAFTNGGPGGAGATSAAYHEAAKVLYQRSKRQGLAP